MQTGNKSARLQEIRKRHIRAQVVYERAKRSSGAVGQLLRDQGAPEEVWRGVNEQEARALELSFRHMRAMELFQTALVTGAQSDFRAFVDAFVNMEPA